MIVVVVGARPNFMKVAPFVKACEKQAIEVKVIHTGQHKGEMSEPFLKELGLNIDYQLPAPSLESLSVLFHKMNPELVVVVGDVDSTRIAAQAAEGFPLAHIEAGLRSGDCSMPEEKNRIIVDSLSDFLFVSELSGMENLAKEGITENCFFVGNIMIDNLAKFPVLVTLHRQSNVDSKERLEKILKFLKRLNRTLIWPLHPRAAQKIKEFKLDVSFIKIIPPVSHSELIELIRNCEYVITDSGGIQEEAVYLGRKTYTLRDSTERPLTLEWGNKLITPDSIIPTIPFWDGKTADRIVNILKQKCLK